MTERSRPWDGTTTGDAVESPYDAGSEWGALFLGLSSASHQSVNKGGVVNGATGFGDLGVTFPSANTVRVASGICWVQGTWYQNDANVDFNIPTPSVSTRIDVIAVRKSWSAQTVRLVRIAGTEGAGAPSLTQSFGVTWDIPVVNVSITTGAVMGLTDRRSFLLVAQHAHSNAADGNPISHAVLTGVTSDQHHAQLHAAAHASGGADALSHTTLSNIGTNTHATIDTHIGTGAASGAHNTIRFNSTGSQSLGTPTDGKIAYCRANGGTLTMTTPSGAIFVGTTNDGADTVINDGDALTLIADGTNWYVY